MQFLLPALWNLHIKYMHYCLTLNSLLRVQFPINYSQQVHFCVYVHIFCEKIRWDTTPFHIVCNKLLSDYYFSQVRHFTWRNYSRKMRWKSGLRSGIWGHLKTKSGCFLVVIAIYDLNTTLPSSRNEWSVQIPNKERSSSSPACSMLES